MKINYTHVSSSQIFIIHILHSYFTFIFKQKLNKFKRKNTTTEGKRTGRDDLRNIGNWADDIQHFEGVHCEQLTT